MHVISSPDVTCQLAAALHPKKVFKGRLAGNMEYGYRNWKHARDALKRHDSCVTHKDAMLSWEQYKQNNANQTSVAHLLDSHREKKIRENRHYIITISHQDSR